MELDQWLNGPLGKARAEQLKSLAIANKKYIEPLVEAFLGDQYRPCQNAAMALSKIGDEAPALIQPYTLRLIDKLDDNPIDAVKRNVIRLLQTQEIPESHQGKLAGHCFDYLASAQTPTAIKAFSMTVLAQLAQQYPELKNELRLIIEDLIKTGSPGIVARGRKTLKQLVQ